MARRRRRRSDSSEPFDGLEDELDVRIASLEEELRNVSLSAAMQARDTQAMRARLEALARDIEEGPVDDEAFEELDELERKFEEFTEQSSNSQKVLAERMGELIVRLDTLGGVGRVEDLPRVIEDAVLNRLDEQLETLGQNLEQRLGSLESARAEQGDVSSTQMHEITNRLEASIDALRSDLDQVLRETQQELSQALAETVSVQQLQQIEEQIGTEVERLQHEVERKVQALRSEVQAQVGDDLAAQLESRASREDVDELRQAVEDLRSSISDAAGLGEKAREAMTRVDELMRRTVAFETQFSELAERTEESAQAVEQHNDKVEMAVKLVNLLEEKVRGVSGLSAGPALPEEEADDTSLGFELDDLLQVMIKHQATDLHLKVGQPPTVRLDGELIPVGNQALSKGDCNRLVLSALDPARKRQFLTDKDLEFAYEIPGARFRASAFLERGNMSAAFHMLAAEIPEIEVLGLPATLKKLALLTNGMVLVSGPTGAGKTTTLATLVDHINTNRKLHLVAIEDPIEFFHEDKMSLVTQREVGSDTASFAEGLKRAVRQDPDVIVVGDLPDAETASAALAAASSGHLVICAISTPSVEKTILRFVELFPEYQQRKIAQKLSRCLRGVLSLRLVNRADGKGQVPACEMMVTTSEIASLIADGTLAPINNLMYNGAAEGMQTLTQSLSRLIEAGLITQEEAMYHAEHQPEAAETRPPSAAAAQGGAEIPRPAPQQRPTAPPAPAASAPPPPPQTGSPEGPSMTEEDTLMNWL